MKKIKGMKPLLCGVLGVCTLSMGVSAEETGVTIDTAVSSTLSALTGNSYKNVAQQPENGTITLYPVFRPVDGVVTITVTPDEGYELSKITAVNDKRLPIILVQTGENTFQFSQPESVITVSAVMQREGGDFTVDDLHDVSISDWFYLFVQDMIERRIMLGTSDGLFEPYANVTRGTMAVIIANIQKVDTSIVTDHLFSDMSSNYWYSGAANWCVRNGILQGSQWDRFEGERDITREELIQALYYYGKYVGHYTHVYTTANLNGYQDTYAIDDECLAAMSWAVQMDFIKGDDGGYLNPKGTATRAEICAILSRFLKAHYFHIYYDS